MFSVKLAEETILKLVQPFNPIYDRESINLVDAVGRILSIDLVSKLDFPHFTNSAMDGYAFHYADLEQFPALEIASVDIPAGASSPIPLAIGQCARILTGGILPDRADTVVMQEDITKIDRDHLKLEVVPAIGENVRPKGAFYRAGSLLLPAGTKIDPTSIGALAAAHYQQIEVYRRPRVAILSTGNELVDLYSQAELKLGQIIDSNQYSIASLVRQTGAIAIPMGIVPDRKSELAQAIKDSIDTADIVISSGGVSVGDYDYVETLLAEMGAEIHIRSVAIKPGKPLTVATWQQDLPAPKLYFGVPGNPVSAMVSFWRFIAGSIAKLSGANQSHWYPKFITATTTQDLHAQGKRETYLWGYLRWQSGQYTFQPVDNYSSGNLISLVGTNALAVLRVNQTYVPAGESVLILHL